MCDLLGSSTSIKYCSDSSGAAVCAGASYSVGSSTGPWTSLTVQDWDIILSGSGQKNVYFKAAPFTGTAATITSTGCTTATGNASLYLCKMDPGFATITVATVASLAKTRGDRSKADRDRVQNEEITSIDESGR
jgi:hypothetical protein